MQALHVPAALGRLARIALIASTVLCLGGPSSSAFAASSGPTITLASRSFPSGNVIPSQLTGTLHPQPGAPQTLTAPDLSPNYAFLFWNLTTDVQTTPSVTFNAPTDSSSILVTAWYVAVSPCTQPCLSGTGVSTYAFSLNNDAVIPATPIASVTPAGAWAGGTATSVSTTTSQTSVAISARTSIGGDGLFHNWLNFGSGSVASSTLTVPYQGASTAVAFFGIPVPDPCASIRTQLDNLNPGDFPTLLAYQRALRQLTSQLRACELQYGEI